jgi:hypothetical protein
VETLVTENTYRLQVTFRNFLRQLADPTTVTLRYEDPSGNVTVVPAGSITNDSTGVYHYDLNVDEAGVWEYRFIGTGAIVASNPEKFLAVLAVP